ncbi:sugar ABC transporter permease [Paenibacillus rigui]|uniref:Sugar ABC transporter permease n=2 Tax=Paenibacillus rigui TaxID=554312 RepID=A0A229UGQ8_9BACL|nr:carbohydrate ABC transporter permease [Paenibacillus rigui]OXM82587.1 sugar ABC transporter permease [Paenibacillus rigui]
MVVLGAGLIVLALLFLSPFYFVFANSVKSIEDIQLHTASLPTKLEWVNYGRAWDVLHFSRALSNSFLITVLSVTSMVILSSMAAYRLVRRPTRGNKFIFLLFVTAMIIPFQTLMIPLVKVGRWAGLLNHLLGIVVLYSGLGVSLCIFLYHGFIKSIPQGIEEAAAVDGCNPYSLFWRIVFPLLKPMTVTIIVLQCLWIWNDFLLPMLVLQKPDLQTIQLAINSLFGQYVKQWDLALPALVITIIPSMALFLALQKHVIDGVAAGAVKG